MMHGRGKSDSAIVAVKPTNKAERSAAEPVEPRAETKGNADQQSTYRAQNRISVSQALDCMRQALAVWTRGRSRMRESCTYGSVRGALSNERPYRDRRAFITLLGGAAASPSIAIGQPARKRPVVGYLYAGSAPAHVNSPLLRAFLGGMRELGYAEGRDFELALRVADGRADKLVSGAHELVQLSPDVIVAPASAQAVVLRNATSTIPIVVPALGDPAALGLIGSEARPGGNVTGIMPYVNGLPAKQLELAREVVPAAQNMGVVNDSADPKGAPQQKEIETNAAKLEIRTFAADIASPDAIEPAFKSFAAARVAIVIVLQTNFTFRERARISAAASNARLPTVFGYRENVEVGGLVSYGVNLNWCFHRGASYVDKILRGTKPADLPVDFRPSWILSSTSKPPRRSDSKSPQPCSPAPTR
jgi:putative ABC transport system substrate-binding protein